MLYGHLFSCSGFHVRVSAWVSFIRVHAILIVNYVHLVEDELYRHIEAGAVMITHNWSKVLLQWTGEIT